MRGNLKESHRIQEAPKIHGQPPSINGESFYLHYQQFKAEELVKSHKLEISGQNSLFGSIMMKGERKIVVAVDESKESMYALSWCLSNLVSHSSKNTLVLLYVKPPPPLYTDASGYMFSTDVVAALEKYGNELVNSVMERTEGIIRNYGTNINVERITGSGDAKDVICSTVGKLGADTLVMGSHGYGFFKRALLGSVSDYCAKHVKCPVVIVKHPEDK